MRIGIPRALLYYQYFPLWRAFFEHLGGEVVVSAPTSRSVVITGASKVVSDTCLPVKVYCSHVASLIGQCDYVFIPGIRSLEKGAYNCSKFLGLPDVARAAVPGCPPIIQVDIDTNLGKSTLYQAVYKVGRYLTWKPWRVKEAAEVAWETHLAYQGLMQREGLTPPEAIAKLAGKTPPRAQQAGLGASDMVVAVIGHPYALYDGYINHRLIDRLRNLGVRVVTPEMAPQEGLRAGVQHLVNRPYWTYEDEVVGAGGYYLESPVDGIISVVPFGCGPDSLMLDVVRRYAQRRQGPSFMSLTIDEHTGEAGLVTRLEAFLDMLQRRKRRASLQR